MKILITGSNGMLGSDLVHMLSGDHEVSGIGLSENRHPNIVYKKCDITNQNQVLKCVSELKPSVIIHAAAYTDVDSCERNPAKCFQVNTQGTEHVVQASSQIGALLFFVSTDYVFDGDKKGFYEETDEPHPVSIYGESKLRAENLVRSKNLGFYIVRLSWLFGEHGPNFFKAIIKKISRGEDLKVVYDQIGAPSYTQDLAKAFRSLVECADQKVRERKGVHIYHLANTGTTSWFRAAEFILEKANSTVGLVKITSDQLRRAAKRPKNSVFNLEKIKKDFQIELRPWQEALGVYWDRSLKKEWEQLVKLV